MLKLFDKQCMVVQELRTEKRQKNSEDEALKRDKSNEQMKFATGGNVLTLSKPTRANLKPGWDRVCVLFHVASMASILAQALMFRKQPNIVVHAT